MPQDQIYNTKKMLNGALHSRTCPIKVPAFNQANILWSQFYLDGDLLLKKVNDLALILPTYMKKTNSIRTRFLTLSTIQFYHSNNKKKKMYKH